MLDGNVYRVLARYFGIDTPTDTTAGKNCYTQLAGEVLHREQPGEYNQAIMDFGAVVCQTPAACLTKAARWPPAARLSRKGSQTWCR